jgi:hypothetical protein
MKANPNLQSATGRRRAILEYLTAKSQTNTSTVTHLDLYNEGGVEKYEIEPDIEDFDESPVVSQQNIGNNPLFSSMDGVFGGGLFSSLNRAHCTPEREPRRVCVFTCKHLDSNSGEATKCTKVGIKLSMAEYIDLLDYKLQIPDADITSLSQHNPQLFKTIERQIYSIIHKEGDNALHTSDYIVEMTEIDDDIQKIISQYGK